MSLLTRASDGWPRCTALPCPSTLVVFLWSLPEQPLSLPLGAPTHFPSPPPRLFHGTSGTDPAKVWSGSVGFDPRCTGDDRFYGNGVCVPTTTPARAVLDTCLPLRTPIDRSFALSCACGRAHHTCSPGVLLWSCCSIPRLKPIQAALRGGGAHDQRAARGAAVHVQRHGLVVSMCFSIWPLLACCGEPGTSPAMRGTWTRVVDAGRYAHCVPGSTSRKMILAHVLCGRTRDYGLQLDRGLKRPPTLPGSTVLADSVQVRSCMCCVLHP